MGVHSAFATPSADGLISEVYGGGGNSGATYTNDFIELANAGSAPLDLTGWTVQYLPGAPTATSKWQVTALTGSLGAGGRYLVGEGAGTGGTTPLPTPDASGAINMSGTTGTVALVHGTDPLTCVTAADCAADTSIRDLVGYGTAVVHEGSGPAAGASNTASVARTSLTDIGRQRGRLHRGSAHPGRRGHRRRPDGHPTATPTTTAPPTTPPPTTTPPTEAKIHDIQGTTRVSPLSREAGHRRARHRHRRADLRLARLLVPGPEPGRRSRHQRGRLRLHRLRPDRRGR